MWRSPKRHTSKNALRTPQPTVFKEKAGGPRCVVVADINFGPEPLETPVELSEEFLEDEASQLNQRRILAGAFESLHLRQQESILNLLHAANEEAVQSLKADSWMYGP